MSAVMSFMCRENNKGPRTVPCGTPDTTGAQSDFYLSIYLSIYTATPSFLSITRRAALRWRKARTYLGIPEYACETTGSARRQPEHIHMGRLTHLKFFGAGEARTRTTLVCGSESEDRRSTPEPRRIPC